MIIPIDAIVSTSKAIKHDLVGKIFNRLTIIKYAYSDKSRKACWLCKCECGNEVIVDTHRLKNGNTKSCGCYKIEKGSTQNGVSSLKDPVMYKLYHSYKAMMSRCFNPQDHAYFNYGLRGITVCLRWSNDISGLANYIIDMQPSYLKHVDEYGLHNTSLDRIKVMGNYEPSNCKWSTWDEQGNNKRRSRLTKDSKLWNEVHVMSSMLGVVIVQNRTSRYADLFGISIEQMRKHIESQFEPWMNWNNYGKLSGKRFWEFDHIKSLRLFDFSKEDSWREAFHYTNYRPLGRLENVIKY